MWRILLAITAAAGLCAQGLLEADRVLVRTWLTTDCGLGGDLKLEARVAARGAILEPAFLEALEKGAPADELAAVERTARERFDKIRKALDDPNQRIEMSGPDREALRAVTADSFARASRDSFTLLWRSQAVAGLALVGGDRSRQALRAVEKDKASPLREGAAAALKRLAERK
jgi:hypothetical protein